MFYFAVWRFLYISQTKTLSSEKMVKSVQGHCSGLLISSLQKDILVIRSHFPEGAKWGNPADPLSSTQPCP